MRTGRLDLVEQQFIKSNVEEKSVEEIALHLNRDPKSILLWIKKNIGFSDDEKKEARAFNELKENGYWKELAAQFDEQELETFSFHWGKLWAQFGDDVFHTEEIQIIDAIKLQLLMNRCLRFQYKNMEQIEQLESMVAKCNEEIEDNIGDREYVQGKMVEIANYERQIAVLAASNEAVSRDYKTYLEKKNDIIRALKGTRDQRLKNIEDNSRQSFGGLVKKLIADTDFRNKVGIDMEKMRLAIDKERERLARPHTYVNGEIDQPFFTADTVI